MQMVSNPRDFVSHWHQPEYFGGVVAVPVAAKNLPLVDVCWKTSVSPAVVVYFWTILSCLCIAVTSHAVSSLRESIHTHPQQLERATIIKYR